MSHFVPLLARNEAINKWLADNPLILAAIFGVLGAALLIIGVLNLVTGQATGKWGSRHSGGMALFLGGIRVLGGIVCLGVSLYGLVKAMF
ncbi:MAG: hypothetical protein ACKVP0_12855 [Pirellulaceae bacterium]